VRKLRTEDFHYLILNTVMYLTAVIAQSV